MRYEVLVTEYPIDINKAEKLRGLGLVVPFIPSDEEFNIYAYIPEGLNITKGAINAIHTFTSLNAFITEEELKRYDQSIKAFNAIEVGDLVAIKGYKNLITKVTAVEGSKVTTEINLRGYIYRFEENVERVSKSNIVYQNIERDFKNIFDPKLYVDCSQFDIINQEFTYVHSLFYFLLRLKLSYPHKEVILINPKFNFHKTFGFGAAIGSKENIKLRNDFLYTEDLTIYEPRFNIVTKHTIRNVNHLVTLDSESFKQITGLRDNFQLKVYNFLLDKYNNSRRLINKAKLKSDILFDVNKVMANHNITKSCLDKELIPIKADNMKGASSFDMNDCFKYLLDKRFINIAENIDYYMTILKG